VTRRVWSLRLSQLDFFPTDSAVCLGPQVAAVILTIDSRIPQLQWYVADVRTVGYQFPSGASPVPWLVGNASTLAEAALAVDQFESGVFVGVQSSIGSPRFRSGGLWTEDDQDADLGDATIEVRAVDTTDIEIYSSDRVLLAEVDAGLRTNPIS